MQHADGASHKHYQVLLADTSESTPAACSPPMAHSIIVVPDICRPASLPWHLE